MRLRFKVSEPRVSTERTSPLLSLSCQSHTSYGFRGCCRVRTRRPLPIRVRCGICGRVRSRRFTNRYPRIQCGGCDAHVLCDRRWLGRVVSPSVILLTEITRCRLRHQDSSEPPLGDVVDRPLAPLPAESGFIRNITKSTSCYRVQRRSPLGEIVQRGITKQ